MMNDDIPKYVPKSCKYKLETYHRRPIIIIVRLSSEMLSMSEYCMVLLSSNFGKMPYD